MTKKISQNKMPKELKQKWLDALRSGEYKQATGALKNGNGYCCLGVLQMVADGKVESCHGKPEEMPSEQWLEDHNISFSYHGMDCISPKFYIQGSREWFGADELNDNLEYDFNKIANYIEKGIEGI
jgi:hypothetical protein